MRNTRRGTKNTISRIPLTGRFKTNEFFHKEFGEGGGGAGVREVLHEGEGVKLLNMHSWHLDRVAPVSVVKVFIVRRPARYELITGNEDSCSEAKENRKGKRKLEGFC
ncbi:hypothetical protein Scep_010264 [Stephania cephalantha]|uniref:Uncharacterized protein n=1 Tax=Stephania cephalantha TaxID=152367 RepID=A0AAP0JW10_9MAGN